MIRNCSLCDDKDDADSFCSRMNVCIETLFGSISFCNSVSMPASIESNFSSKSQTQRLRV